MYNKFKVTASLLLGAMLSIGCSDTTGLEDRLNEIESGITDIEEAIADINAGINAINSIAKSDIFIVGRTELEHGYKLEISSTESTQIIEVTYGTELPSGTLAVSIDENGDWVWSTDSGSTWTKIEGADNAHNPEAAVPELSIDSENYWCISFGGGESSRILDSNGKPISAVASADAALFRDVTYDAESGNMIFTLASGEVIDVPVIEDFYLNVIGYKEGVETICLDEKREYEVEMSSVASAHIQDLSGWSIVLEDNKLTVTGPSSGDAGDYDVVIYLVSDDNLMKVVTLKFTLNPVRLDANAVKQYNDFVAGNTDNVLLDFSYAGYNHGETAPANITVVKSGNSYTASNGYTVYDVTAYGAVPDDGLSDRAAFIAALEAALGKGISSNNENGITFQPNENARAIVYFPEGEYILHTADDNVADASYPEGAYTQPINIRANNFVLKGAGRDKTRLVMKDPALPASKALYSSPAMLTFRHNTAHTHDNNKRTTVTGDAAKGSFSVEVASTSGLSAGDWVCLYVLNGTQEALQAELGEYLNDSRSSTWEITKTGVRVEDYHQIASVSGNTVTFVEPLMHAVDKSWGWEIHNFSNYSEVGVEDLTFVGNAKDDFVHHGHWKDDGAYKPLYFVRLTDSWIRRVGFESVSEALSITGSANVSAYDILITGNRGHSSIRSDGSSRVFIGAVKDISNGPAVGNGPYATKGEYIEAAGQYHAVGVAKPSMGAVLWRNQWGKDACFESHATQPRATLIDCCRGGWMIYRQGGDSAQMPNHLADLTIWNFNTMNGWSGTFDWWDYNSEWWKFLPPVIVGFHGEGTVAFNNMTVDSSNGTAVEPESLYEAQLRLRLGSVPAWLNSLK